MSSNIEINKVCESCGAVFTARTTTTRYCSHKCNSRAYKAKKRGWKIENVQQRTETLIKLKPIEKIKDKEFFSISEAALFMGVSRPTVYKYLYSGELKSTRLSGKTFIQRSAIYELFNSPQDYKPRPNIERKPITDFYTVAEIQKKYNVGYGWIYKLVKANNIPKVADGGKVYYSKQHIDNYFKTKGHGKHNDISEWHSVDEICETYNMTKTAVYCFVSDNQIPRKKEGKFVYYSKKHFDIVKGHVKADEVYYTVQEAIQKFNITRDALYHYIKYHKIPKVKNGKYINVSKPDLDRLFEQPMIIT